MKTIIAILVSCGYFFAVPLFAADVMAGKEKAAAVCAACHGVDGNKTTSPDFPKLAGQHPDYLFKALSDYKSGARNNPIMSPQAKPLSDKDMKDLAAYYASLSGLVVKK